MATVPVTPSVLDWAIKEAGQSTEGLADEVGEPAEVVHAWRQGDVSPTTAQFHKLARALKRPETFFLLARPPQSAGVPPQFRSAPRLEAGTGVSAEDASSIRVARRVQRVSSWLVDQGIRTPAALMSLEPFAPAETAAQVLRDWLAWSETVETEKTEAKAARRARTELEARGVLVLHTSLGPSGWRGFSLNDTRTPVLVANTYYSYRPRIFTYLHELVHLSTGTESICAINPQDGLERWCDQVAGAVLMPAAAVRSFVRDEMKTVRIGDFEGVRRVANSFKASLRASAIRLEHLGLAVDGLYSKVEQVARVREVRGSGAGGGDPQTTSRVRIQTFGQGYLGPVLEAEDGKVLTRTDTMELLDVSGSQLDELRSMAAVGTDD